MFKRLLGIFLNTDRLKVMSDEQAGKVHYDWNFDQSCRGSMGSCRFLNFSERNNSSCSIWQNIQFSNTCFLLGEILWGSLCWDDAPLPRLHSGEKLLLQLPFTGIFLSCCQIATYARRISKCHENTNSWMTVNIPSGILFLFYEFHTKRS